MKTIHLALGIHNHQPVGNFDFVFEEAYIKAYKPFLDILKRFPSIKIGMHYTGIIFDWLDRSYPELIDELRGLVDRGQIEMIGGGFYEPIMPIIPDHDKLGQIEKLNRFVHEKTGVVPRGMWMAERVWEPHLPKTLAEAGMRYTILDDTHFQYAGLQEDQLFGYYVTEELGFSTNLFPISKKLRYTIPFQDPEKTIAYLREHATEDGNALAVFADDGEKFGIWPGTHEHVYTNKWLEKFFTLLEKNSDWIRIIHFSEALEKIRPLGTVYLPTASYSEMQHWALPVKSYQEYEHFEKELKQNKLTDPYGIFVRGGFWRNFFVKYSEANRMHKKMLRISRRLHQLQASANSDDEEITSMIRTVQDHLWASQCNCPYWHGVFGGIYLNNIRYALYKEMLLAEKFLDVIEHGSSTTWHIIEQTDYDADGNQEILFETLKLNAYFDSARGGTLLELDYKDIPMNVTDVLMRREEGYHEKLIEFHRQEELKKTEEKKDDSGEIASIHDLVLSKEKNLHEFLIKDSFRRHSFMDSFWNDTVMLDHFYKNERKNIVTVDSPCASDILETEKMLSVRYTSVIRIASQDVHWSKIYTLIPGTSILNVAYEIQNASDKILNTFFGTEINLTLLAGDADDRYYYAEGLNLSDKKLRSKGEWQHIGKMGLVDGWQKINIQFNYDREATVWRYPVETISLSEEGFERVYQGSCILPFWNLRLDAGEQWKLNIQLSLSREI
ncbi:DUF1926 domain-containing protein [bacterium]|nr:DUF1926 domain-containing protein [bacterium]